MERKREARYNSKVRGYREAEGGKVGIEVEHTPMPLYKRCRQPSKGAGWFWQQEMPIVFEAGVEGKRQEGGTGGEQQVKVVWEVVPRRSDRICSGRYSNLKACKKVAWTVSWRQSEEAEEGLNEGPEWPEASVNQFAQNVRTGERM
ncbi:hypothetical protein DFH08DRAFT_814498 [Mycena albidolilacea]|uniref:Uncharacterized protein n=1 Tax=Mycena albidolilacea TaxID=1033008 RepID=A0AAD7EKL4_9AGAR|nr:hypothetical protein DFH08DRAFT_814498 [Mycena albidolilacea]